MQAFFLLNISPLYILNILNFKDEKMDFTNPPQTKIMVCLERIFLLTLIVSSYHLYAGLFLLLLQLRLQSAPE